MRTLSSIRRRKIVTESGRSLGRCHDVRGELGRSGLRVTGLVFGRRGLLEHLGIRGEASATPARVRDTNVIPWEAIIRFDGDGIVVRDDS